MMQELKLGGLQNLITIQIINWLIKIVPTLLYANTHWTSTIFSTFVL